ncbi:LOW QUALITY PROTEIN: hypothetical protein Cgig2_004597 [Carnegiea gigantea]|uniref:DUF4283 domain-containing protein n=1 Tax=Carnegiea gigantea TaxID=171969 RepID=A0A9Q1GI21_9CARY|nr:LOW QUALITY PROTEIN: hypothetical protein Cgig2_004597 [Carnegiea gigantea]
MQALTEQVAETPVPLSIPSTYASMVDPEEGTELKFVPTKIINGVKCAKIKKEDVMPEIEFWQSAILCSILGANPPFEGYLNRIWANYKIKRVIQVRKGVFLGWNPEMDLNTDKIKSLPLWVQFPNLDIKYWGLESIKYEWLPLKCTRCHMFGHEEVVCKKKKVIRQEWREVQQHPSDEERQIQPDQQSTEHGQQVFTPVPRKSIAKQQQSQFKDQPPQQENQVDRVLINAYWFEPFDFTLTHYLTNGLSNHAPMLIEFTSTPKPKPRFQFCDMWCQHTDFFTILGKVYNAYITSFTLNQLKHFLNKLRPQLQKLYRDHYADLREQQDKARRDLNKVQAALQHDYCNQHLLQEEKNTRARYIDWTKHGDDNARFFFAKAKQKNMTSYIYTIQDAQGNQVEGFDQVGHIIFDFYKQLLGKQSQLRSPIKGNKTNNIYVLAMIMPRMCGER